MIKTSLQEFLAAHTTKWDKVLIYDWELANLTSAIDSSLADKWYDATQDYIDYNEYTLQLHGDILRVTIPVFSVQEELNDITQEYREWLSDYLKDWLLSDRKWAILFKLLDSFSVSEKDWRLAFATLWDVSDKILKTVKVNQVSIGDFKTDITITASNEITRYENIILLFKEVSDWYYDVRKHSIVDKVGWQYQQQEYTLGRDIIAKINTKTREVIEVTQIDTEYASRKDKDWWYVIKPDGTEESTSTFLPYKSTIDGDITTLEFYWAYTHVLRDLLDFKPLTWQYKYLLNENRINFLATARRAGKCLAPDTSIRLSDWSIKKAIDLTLDDKLLASDKKGSNNINVIEYYKKDIYRVTLDNWMYIDVTWDHRCPTQNTYSKNGWDMNIDNYTTALELTTDDFLPVMKWTDVGENSYFEIYESALAWYIYWDWCKHNSWTAISVHNNDIVRKLMRYCSILWYSYFFSENNHMFYIHDKMFLKRKYKWLNELSYNKFIDNKFFGFSKEAKWKLVEWLINTDWCILYREWQITDFNRKPSVKIEYCSTSEKMARQYQEILSDLWIVSYIRKKKIYTQWNKTKEYSWNVYISNKKSLISVFDNCDLYGKKNYHESYMFLQSDIWYTNNTIGNIPLVSFKECNVKSKTINGDSYYNWLRSPKYNYNSDKCSNYWLEHWDNYSWHKVISVEFLRNDIVVDIEIWWDSTYWANNILTHNTRYIAYAIARWLWKMPNSNKHVQRQIKLLYTAPSEDKQKEVIDYIKSSWERIRLLKVLDFNKKENRLYLYDEVIGRNQKIANVVASCDFVSAKGFEPWRGKASDEIFIDEASITPEDTWLNLLPIIGNERAKVVCVWTIDWSTRKQWFYSSLIESERWVDVEQFGMRVTIDDLDEAHVPLIDRDRMKRMFINNKDRYYAELYATFPDNNSVFNSEWFFSINKDRPPGEKIGGYIIWYDPAKRTDIWAVEVAEYRINNAWQTYVQIIEEHSLRGEYTEQKNVLASIKQRYMDASYWAPVYVVIDATQVWDVVAEMFGDIVNYKVWYTAKGKRPTIDAYGAWKVPKNHLVHLSQILMEKWIMKGWVGLKELIEELRNFKAIDTAAGNVKYEAEVGHDDHVNAMMLIGFYVGYIDWKVYEFAVDWDISRGEWITDEWLYESTTTRWVTNILESVYWVWYKFWV